jgi:carboxyl-terminal processing protease
MKRRLIFGVAAAALALNLAIGAAIYLNPARAAEQKDSMDANLDLFANVLQKVRAEYVDGTNLTYRNLTDAAIKGMIGSLDPHSEFLDAQDYQQLQDETEGQFGGLGLVVEMINNYVTVVAPMEDSPGFRAGILTGDRIVKVDGKGVERMPLGGVVKLLRGDPGTSVTVTVQRPSTGEEKKFTLTRAIIQVDMVKDINGRKEFPLGGIWRPDRRRTGSRARQAQGAGDEGADSGFALEPRRFARRGGERLPEIPPARPVGGFHRRPKPVAKFRPARQRSRR